jgi:hypothetical protein
VISKDYSFAADRLEQTRKKSVTVFVATPTTEKAGRGSERKKKGGRYSV